MLSKVVRRLGLGLLVLMLAFYFAAELGGTNRHTTISVATAPVLGLAVFLLAAITSVVLWAPPRDERQTIFAKLRALPAWRVLLMSITIPGVCLLISYYFILALAEDVRGIRYDANATVTRVLRSNATRYNCAWFIDLQIEARGEVSACLEPMRGAGKRIGPESLAVGDAVLVEINHSSLGESIVHISAKQ